MKRRKLVYKLNAGGYYCWSGESTACIVNHSTSNLHDANDFSSYLDPEHEWNRPSGAGKFVWIDIEYTEAEDYQKEEDGTNNGL